MKATDRMPKWHGSFKSLVYMDDATHTACTRARIVVRCIVKNSGQHDLDGHDFGALACASRDTEVDWDDVKRSYALSYAQVSRQEPLP